MDPIPYTVERTFHVYTASFREPAFALLGNPAPLYANLLRLLGPYGASVEGLSLDLTTLAEAQVVCHLAGNSRARVKLTGLDLSVSNLPSPEFARELVSALWVAVQASDSSLKANSHSVSAAMWGRLENSGYREFVKKFVSPIPSPSGADDVVSGRVTWLIGRPADKKLCTLSIEEADGIRGGLFVRVATDYDDDIDLAALESDFEELVPALLARLGLRLNEPAL